MAPSLSSNEAALPDLVVRWRWRRLVIALLVLLAAIGEVAGRAYGLHRPVVYEQTGYGYRVAPNQDLRRFGNRIRYNEFGLRNEATTREPPAGLTRVLCLGDSVTNGGAITDQSETVTRQMEEFLQQGGRKVEVLNASAPGWAVANELGWLRNFGTFGSRYLVLIISTHDLFQGMAPADTVDSHPSFPSSRPVFALHNVVTNYLLPRILPEGSQQDPGAAGVEASELQARRNREDIIEIVRFAIEQKARPIVVFLEQGGDNGHDAVTLGAKRRFFSLMAREQIPVVTLSGEVETLGRQTMFRDDVHPNPAGNRSIATAVVRELQEYELAMAARRPIQ